MLDFKLSELKIGDDAIIEDPNGDMVLVKITKETRTQLVAGDTRFHKKGGYQVGSSNTWSRLSKLHSVTPERMLRVEEYKATQYRQRLVKAIVKFRLDLLPKEILEQVYLLIKNNLPTKENNNE